jgi:glycosyltransferase involved in cell wall biosynthesis
MSIHETTGHKDSVEPLDATVLFDGRALDGGSITGIGRYSVQCIETCLAIDPAIDFSMIMRPGVDCPFEGHPRVTQQAFPASANSWIDQAFMRYVLDFEGIDLYHGPANVLPWQGLPVPAVMTLHDLLWIRDENLQTDIWWRDKVTGAFYRVFVPRAIEQADHLLTVTHSVADEIVERFDKPRDQITVSPNGVDPFFRPVDSEQGWSEISQWLDPGTPFVLIVGRGAPYKNHAVALESFIEAFGTDDEMHLLMIRTRGLGSDRRFRQLLSDFSGSDRVVITRDVTAEQLRAFYSLSELLLFPSVYEGFGLPILEAMACGTPVVTANYGAMQEVADDAAICVDPGNSSELADAMISIVEQEELAERLVDKGKARAQTFGWERTGRRVHAAYRRLLADSAD